jgi:DNA mismatch repair protein MutS
MRARTEAGRAQLDLFLGGPPDTQSNPVLEMLRAVDTDRLTPLEALQLIASLKKKLE